MGSVGAPPPVACVDRHFRPGTLAARLDLSVGLIELAIARYEETGGAEGLGPVSRPTTACVLIPEWAVNRWLPGRREDDAPLEEHCQLSSWAERLDVSVEVLGAAMARWDASPPQRRDGLGPRVRLGPKVTLLPASAVKAWLSRGLIGGNRAA